MAIDEAGRDDRAAGIDDLGIAGIDRGRDCGDDAAIDQQVAAHRPPPRIERDEPSALQQEAVAPRWG